MRNFMSVLIATIAIVSLCSLSSAQAELLSVNYNFGDSHTGGDITSTPGYADWTPADNDYTGGTGYGWLFTNDPGANSSNAMLKRDRSGTADPTPENTLVIDTRLKEGEVIDSFQNGDAALRDPFTFRVDLPNGVYEIEVGQGDPLKRMVTTIHVGDTFLAGNPDALDELASNSVQVGAPGNTTLQDEYILHDAVEFEVTEGYLLVGFRRTEGSIRTAGINDVRITEIPEPGTMSLLAVGAGLLMIRRRRRA